MKKLYNAGRVNDFDRAMREKYGLESLDLINSAARIAFGVIRNRIREKRVLVLVGSGNNGADGLALFLLMREDGFFSDVYYVEAGKSEENRHLRTLIPSECIVSDLEGYDVIIDAVYGASYHPPLKDDVKNVFDRINAMKAMKIALDVPSAYYLKADITVTFTMLKKEEYLLSSDIPGRIILANPGFPEEEISIFPPDSYLLEDEDYNVKEFECSDYKNTRGHLLIKAGSPSYKGAALLSAKAAFHAGCGLVTLNTETLTDLALHYPPLIVNSGSPDYSRYSALLSGPGWGEDAERSFLDFRGNMVLDAEALTQIERGDDFAFRAILTPHVGEMRRLTSRLGVDDDARVLSKTLRAIVVRKSSIVEIAYGDTHYYYPGNNPSLGVAGSGDVLSGIIAAFLASGMVPLDAALNGVILHQMAGKRAHEHFGYYDSLDLINEVGRLR